MKNKQSPDVWPFFLMKIFLCQSQKASYLSLLGNVAFRSLTCIFRITFYCSVAIPVYLHGRTDSLFYVTLVWHSQAATVFICLSCEKDRLLLRREFLCQMVCSVDESRLFRSGRYFQ